MRIGILGSGLMGGKLGTIWARAGHEVVFSYARSKQKLEKLAREAQGNAQAGTPGEAAREANALLRSEEHTSELQSRLHLVCRLLLEKKKKKKTSRDHNAVTLSQNNRANES